MNFLNITTSDNVEVSSNICVVPTGLPESINPAVDYVQASIVLITMVLGITMNGFVVLFIGRHKRLHKMAFFLALQLIVAHLIFSAIVLPVMFVTAVLREWRLGIFMCQLLGSIHDLVITSRYLLTFVLTIDRVISVFFPFFHSRHGGKVSICNSMLAWTVSIIRSVTSLMGVLDCTKYVPTFKMCSGAPFCSDICQVHTLFFSAILALFGVVLPFILYAFLFCKVRIIKHQLNKSVRHQQNVAVLSQLHTSPRSKSQTRTQDQHNHRTTITFLILTIVIIGCALPPYILYTVQFILGANSPPIVTILQIVIGRTLIYSLVAADPIIIMRNSDVRELLMSKFHRSAVSRSTLRRFSLSSLTSGTNGN